MFPTTAPDRITVPVGADSRIGRSVFKKAGRAVTPVAGLGEGAFYDIYDQQADAELRQRPVVLATRGPDGREAEHRRHAEPGQDRVREDAEALMGGMTVRRIRRYGGAMLIFMSLAVIVLLTAHAAPAGNASPGNACELLTLKDVQDVLGSGFTPRPDAPLAGQFPTMSNCAYSKGGDSAVVVGLQRTIYDSAQYLKMTQEGIKQQGGGVAVTPVGGLGEGAFYVVDPRQKPPVFTLQFGKGNLEVVLSVLTGGKPNIEGAQKLAKIAYSRLK